MLIATSIMKSSTFSDNLSERIDMY